MIGIYLIVSAIGLKVGLAAAIEGSEVPQQVERPMMWRGVPLDKVPQQVEKHMRDERTYANEKQKRDLLESESFRREAGQLLLEQPRTLSRPKRKQGNALWTQILSQHKRNFIADKSIDHVKTSLVYSWTQTLSQPKELEASAASSVIGTVRSDAISRLRSDSLFMAHELPSRPARGVVDGCDFQGHGFLCGIEFPEQTLVRKWIPTNAVVMEFGARFGTTTCEIAKKLGNNGNVISFEPDTNVWPDLEANLASHDCAAHVVRGVLGSKPVQLQSINNMTNYGSRTVEVSDVNAPGAVPAFQFDEIEQALGFKVDTLLLDCEGCGQHMMDQLGPKMSQINLVLFEADAPVGAHCAKDCMDYKRFIAFLKQSGLEQVDEFNDCNSGRSKAPVGTWCGNWIKHYAFRRPLR